MKDIHVIIIGNTRIASIKQTLSSLQFILPRIEGVSVLVAGNEPHSHANIPAVDYKLRNINVVNKEIGTTLASLLQEICCDYVLILFNGDCLMPNIRNIKLKLCREQKMMTYFYKVKNMSVEYPFLLKTSFLQSSSFLNQYMLPFSEAIFPALLSFTDKSDIVAVREKIIGKFSMKWNADMIEKTKFIKKLADSSSKKTNPPTIAVILANYNMAEYIGVTISSCLLQTYPPDQILVIDDGSTDHSLKEIEKWRDFSNVLIRHQENGGKARALNALLPYIKADFVIEIDADDWLDPDAFTNIRRHLLDLPADVNVLYGNLRTWKQKEPDEIFLKGIKRGNAVRNKEQLLSYPFPLGPRVYRAAALKAVGFPVIDYENGRMYEDVSVLYRLLKKGRLSYRDFTVYNVREHPNSITKRNRSDWNDFLKYIE